MDPEIIDAEFRDVTPRLQRLRRYFQTHRLEIDWWHVGAVGVMSLIAAAPYFRQ